MASAGGSTIDGGRTVLATVPPRPDRLRRGRRVVLGTLPLVLALAVLGCGDSKGDGPSPGDTSVTTAGATTPSSVATTAPAGCTGVAAEAIRLSVEYAREVRGVAGADEATYRGRAQELAAEAQRLGCGVPPNLQVFLD